MRAGHSHPQSRTDDDKTDKLVLLACAVMRSPGFAARRWTPSPPRRHGSAAPAAWHRTRHRRSASRHLLCSLHSCLNILIASLQLLCPSMGVSEIKEYLIWGPYNKDPTTWGTILGPPSFRNPHIVLLLLFLLLACSNTEDRKRASPAAQKA